MLLCFFCVLLWANADRLEQVALKQKGIDKLVEEAREDQKENDHVYMGRK